MVIPSEDLRKEILLYPPLVQVASHHFIPVSVAYFCYIRCRVFTWDDENTLEMGGNVRCAQMWFFF